ncbi:MAG: hypothetical protein KGL35_08750 [Bradyrhizobium sp.]|nr:hypothetical protein [Bradyrhizobium sp.]
MKRARHSDLFLSPEDAELYAKQSAMAENVANLKSKKAKGQQVAILIRSLAARLRAK